MLAAREFRLVGLRLVDGTGARPVEDAEVHVVAGRITFAGDRTAAPPTGDDVPVVDLRRRTVLPGFFDCHVHVTHELTETTLQRTVNFGSYATMQTGERLRRTLDAGVTTIRDLGGLDEGVKRALADGLLVGPRARIAVQIISPTCGHTDFLLPNGQCPDVELARLSYQADTDDEVLVATRHLLRAGADLIKVCTTGGIMTPNDQPDDLGLSAAQVAVIRTELDRHADRRHIAVHAQGTEGILAALRGGADSIEHGYAIDEEGIELMHRRGAFLVPTLSALFHTPDPALVPARLYDKKMRFLEIAQDRLAAALRSGVRVALGTDSAVCPHGQNLRELGYLVELGMSPADAIVAGTSNAAQLLDVADSLGTVEAGKIADLVAVSGDPLADIAVLADPKNVELVIQGGAVVKDSCAVTAAPTAMVG